MKEFLLLFWNESGNGGYALDPDKMKSEMSAWQTWIGNIAMMGQLVSTKPIEWRGSTISNKGVDNAPAIPGGVMVTGYMLCRAKSEQEVKDWAHTCPILKSPKGFTEIREVSPFEI